MKRPERMLGLEMASEVPSEICDLEIGRLDPDFKVEKSMKLANWAIVSGLKWLQHKVKSIRSGTNTSSIHITQSVWTWTSKLLSLSPLPRKSQPPALQPLAYLHGPLGVNSSSPKPSHSIHSS